MVSARRDIQQYWLQKQHIAGDNNFDPYILYAKEPSNHVLESYRLRSHREKESFQIKHNQKLNKQPLGLSLPKGVPWCSLQHLTTFAVIFGISGFAAQFQGLRFSNWTCSVSQLIALAVATCLRALVRRNMTKTPGTVPVNNDYILDHLTLAIIGNGSNSSARSIFAGKNSPRLSFAFGVTTIPKLRVITNSEFHYRDWARPKSGHSHRANPEPLSTGSQPLINAGHSTEAEAKPNLAQKALDLRVRLGQITKWTGPKAQEAVMLSNSIEAALKTLNPRLPIVEKCAVVLQINTGQDKPHRSPTSRSNNQGEVELIIMRDGDEWKVDDAQLEALLSLVSFSAWTTKQKGRNQEETGEEKSSSSSDSSGRRVEKQIVENRQSIGWLRAKALDSQIYQRIVGKLSPKLVSDLSWWIVDAVQSLEEVAVVDEFKEISVSAFPSSSSSDFKAKYGKVVEPLVLGFYVDKETSKESSMYAI